MALTIRDINRLRRELTVVRNLPRQMWQRSFRVANLPEEVSAACMSSRSVQPAYNWLDAQANAINIRAAAPVSLPRMFGVEIECYNANRQALITAAAAAGLEILSESYNHDDAGHYKIVSDSSLNGNETNEVVSSPANDFADLKKVCTALKQIGAKVNKSCGLHVHIDAAGLSPAHIARIVNNYVALYPLIAKGLAPSRLDNSFCRLNRPFVASRIADFEERDIYSSDRYRAVNLCALRRHGTIEFRQHQGSLNFTKIKNWVMFLESLVAWSEEHLLTGGCVVEKNDARIAGLRVDLLRDLTTRERRDDAA